MKPISLYTDVYSFILLCQYLQGFEPFEPLNPLWQNGCIVWQFFENVPHSCHTLPHCCLTKHIIFGYNIHADN